MPSTHTLKSHRSGKVLFEGQFDSIRDCLEKAVQENLDLTGIDLSFKNLSNGNFDGALMADALLHCTNLSGANLSETMLDKSNFTNAALYNTCLCESSLEYCNFTGANFGATNIAGAFLSGSTFSTLSSLNLEFIQARSIRFCVYTDIDGQTTKFSTPPIVLYGVLNTPIVIFEKIVKIGNSHLPLHTFAAIGQKMFDDILLQRTGKKPHKANILIDKAKYTQLY